MTARKRSEATPTGVLPHYRRQLPPMIGGLSALSLLLLAPATQLKPSVKHIFESRQGRGGRGEDVKIKGARKRGYRLNEVVDRMVNGRKLSTTI